MTVLGVERCLLIRLRRGFVAAFQNRVVQIGRVRFARVERDDDAFTREIDGDIAHAVNFHQHRAQFSYARIAIFAFSCDLDCFENGVIGPFGIERVARFGFVWSRGIHHLLNVARRRVGRLPRDGFEHTPDILGENFLAGGIWVNPIAQI
jgi:hypothetical protein